MAILLLYDGVSMIPKIQLPSHEGPQNINTNLHPRLIDKLNGVFHAKGTLARLEWSDSDR